MRARAGWRWLGLLLPLLLLLTLVTTDPLVRNPWSAVPENPGDPLLHAWVLAWDARALAGGGRGLFDANIFYPHTGTLTYAEHLLGSALLAFPVLVLTDNPVFAHNLLVLLSFVLTGLTAALLIRALTGNATAASLGGLISAFSTFRFAHIGHLHVLTGQWTPLALLFLHRFLRDARWQEAAWLSFFSVLQLLSSGHHGLYLMVAAAWLLMFEAVGGGPRPWRLILRRGALAVLLCAAVVAPVAAAYVRAHQAAGLSRSMEEVRAFSADFQHFLATPPGNWLYGPWLKRLGEPAEWTLFPGLLPVALAALGVISVLRPRGRTLQGPADRRMLLGYGSLAVLGALLALGPVIRVRGSAIGPGPYALLYHYVPGFGELRVPSRFASVLTLGLAVTAGFGMRAVVKRLRGTGRAAGVLLLGAGLLGEHLYVPIDRPPARVGDQIPQVYRWLGAQPGRGAVIELPFLDVWSEAARTYYSTAHWKPLVNGYSGYEPPLYRFLREELAGFPSSGTARLLSDLGVRFVVLHPDLYGERWRRVELGLPALEARIRPVAVFSGVMVYEIQDSPAAELAPACREALGRTHPLPRDGWVVWASSRPEQARLLLDGRQETRWESEAVQRPGQWVALNLGQLQRIAGLRLALGAEVFAYPRVLRVEASLNGRSWWTAMEPIEPVPPLVAYARRPRPLTLVVLFPELQARWIRLTQLGHAPARRWGMAEIDLLPPFAASPTPCAPGPGWIAG